MKKMELKENKQRVISYVDGFNLYHGLKDGGWQRYYWLNLHLLSANLLKPWQALLRTKYFTSKISNKSDPGSIKRQAIYLEALSTIDSIDIFYGHYLPKKQQCFKCGYKWVSHEEKMTDVNIAVELIGDAFADKFDTAIVVSADSDLAPPILFIRQKFPDKKIIAAFPPNRHSDKLRNTANAAFTIGRKILADSIFTPEVTKTDGYTLKQPDKWK